MKQNIALNNFNQLKFIFVLLEGLDVTQEIALECSHSILSKVRLNISFQRAQKQYSFKLSIGIQKIEICSRHTQTCFDRSFYGEDTYRFLYIDKIKSLHRTYFENVFYSWPNPKNYYVHFIPSWNRSGFENINELGILLECTHRRSKTNLPHLGTRRK